MTVWVVLSTEWKLEDVQAGLNVIITVLCFTFILTSSRFLWHRSVDQVSKDHDVRLTSLLTFTSVGEAIDIISLFKTELFQPKYAILGVQCFIVAFFSLASILAGPISRYSTKVGQTIVPRPVQGQLASRSLSCDVNDNVRWQKVFTSLDNASFPLDQLLDYLPNTDSNWVYTESEWNSTYSAKCTFTPQTNITLYATGNYVNNSLLYLYSEIPGMWDILSPRFQNKSIVHHLYYDGYRDPANGVWDDVIMWQYVDLTPSDMGNDDNITSQNEQTAFSIASIYMMNAPEYNSTLLSNDEQDWVFGIGDIPMAYYTKVECDIRRNRPQDQNYWEAYPQIMTTCDLARQLDIYWSPTALQPSADSMHSIVNIPSGEEIFRFYQAWMISKDTSYSYPHQEAISQRLASVELAIPFIVVCSLVLLIALLGLVHWGFYRLSHGKRLEEIPETKVGWILQSVKEAQMSSLSSSTPSSPRPEKTNFKQNQIGKNSMNLKETWKQATFKLQQDQDKLQKGLGKIQLNSSIAAPVILSPTSPQVSSEKSDGAQISVSEI